IISNSLGFLILDTRFLSQFPVTCFLKASFLSISLVIHVVSTTLWSSGAAASPGRKQKAAAGGDEKNRRALGDIGNRVNFRDVDGQVSKRHFSTRIVLQKQIHFNPIASDSSFQSSIFLPDSRKVQPQISLPVARSVESQKSHFLFRWMEYALKPAFVAANVRGKEGAKAAKPPKVAVKSKTEEVIEISSGDEGAKAAEQKKVSVNLKTEEVIKFSSGKGDRRTCRKMMVHTLTSVLTARSKVNHFSRSFLNTRTLA
ncbi:hypothetical protein GW17_00015336, partial [Ensete ventricosum]